MKLSGCYTDILRLPGLKLIFSGFLLFGLVSSAIAQDTGDVKQVTSSNLADTLAADTTRVVEVAPLDISSDRGLYIVTPDKEMQLRILGSVRYLVVFDEQDLISKNGFSTYEIPTGDENKSFPNYYNGLDQTRLGFEITRRTLKGDIFIRLETDFAGENGFRIRHAYGQFGKFLFGQTWSLFSHVNSLPATVAFSGPTSSTVTRTPQLRFMARDAIGSMNLAVGLEYIIPSLGIPDSVSSFQLIPDLTLRLDNSTSWGSYQFSAIIPVLSGRNSQEDLVLKTGWGVSASAVLNSWKQGKWYFQGVIGEAITRYLNDLSDHALDVVLDPDGRIRAPLTTGFYVTYEHNWKDALYSNLGYGWIHMEKYSFQPEATYLKGHSLRMNTFWDITDGATIGMEGIWGNRLDIGKQTGHALRLNILFYYDF